MPFDETLYNKLLYWAQLRSGNNFDIIHDTWLHCYDNDIDFNENNCKGIATRLINTEIRESLSKFALIGDHYYIPKHRISLIAEEKTCIYCKQTKPISEFDLYKGQFPRQFCKKCRKHNKKRYYKPKYLFIDISTGKKYSSLVAACKELGLKYHSVANYMFKKRYQNYTNKTNLRRL